LYQTFKNDKKMIDAIEINNFRCFHQTKIGGFKSINLIGGKNNSGKTALLEAVYCVEKQDNYLGVLKERYGDLAENNDREKIYFIIMTLPFLGRRY
jgi:AAA15 family ATPase/GTPase